MKGKTTLGCDTCIFGRTKKTGEKTCARFHGVEKACIQLLNSEYGNPCDGYISKSEKISGFKQVLIIIKDFLK